MKIFYLKHYNFNVYISINNQYIHRKLLMTFYISYHAKPLESSVYFTQSSTYCTLTVQLNLDYPRFKYSQPQGFLDNGDLDLFSASPIGHALSGLISHALPFAWNVPRLTPNSLCWANFQIRSLPSRSSPWLHSSR